MNSKCICIELRNAAQIVTKLYDERLADTGIRITHLSLLNHIRELGAVTLKQLAEVTGLDRSTLGRNLRLLEKKGLVALSEGDDARTKTTTLTRAGRGALRQAAPVWLNTQAQLTTKLGPQKRALLHELLNDLIT